MKLVPISTYLEDFTESSVITDIPPVEVVQNTDEIMVSQQLDEPLLSTELEAPVDRQIEIALDQLRQQLEAEFQVRLAEEKSSLTDEYEARIEELQNGLCERLCKQLDEGISGIETNIANAVCDILESFVSKLAEQKIIDELAGIIRKILREAETGEITLHGPEKVLEAINAKLADRSSIISCHPDDSAEVTVKSDKVWIRSSLESWSSIIAWGDEDEQ